jgi:hypothetical protein
MPSGPSLTSRSSMWNNFAEDLTNKENDTTTMVKKGKVNFFNDDDNFNEDTVNQLSVNFINNNKIFKKTMNPDITDDELVIDVPQNPIHIGSFQTKCKLLKNSIHICCMNLNIKCEHRHNVIKTSDYKWHNKCIIVAAENATNGLFNFLLPLRAKARSTLRLKPIVLLLLNK